MIKECGVGYFQFETKEDGLYINVYPPKEGKKATSIDDVMYYIDKKQINCDIVKLDEAIKQGRSTVASVKVSPEQVHTYSEFGDYRISRDGMKVEAVFYPPFIGADLLSVDEIVRDLEYIGIKHGIQESVIKDFVATREYGKAYTVALGSEPRNGSDGYIEYKFDIDLKPSPKMNDDGTVDFHSLENINHVSKGDVVAVLHPEDRGDAGMDVLGRKVNPAKVNHVIFRFGRNMVISEDGLKLISQVSGHVILEGDKIFVSNVLELVDVDNSTGDIDYEGDVNIKGNILAGFTVKASGDVIVNGIMEGATVIAGGSITFNRGVQGMNKAVIKAGGNIVSKFIESAESVTAGGDIESDSILHSKVISKGTIRATGRNGLIIGGDVKAIVSIEAKTIGNSMGTNTTVGVGVDPAMKRRVDELKKSLGQLGDNKIQLNQVLTALRKKQQAEGELSPDKKELQAKTMRNVIMLEQEINKQKKEFEEIRGQLGEEKNASIKVSNTCFVGTKIMFGDLCMFVKEKYDHCQFRKEGADIKCMAL
ncbi:MAG: FapA family protein [Eubacteriales bacterium]|nr:FapA family protein [Eubacteriales bacterium]